MAMARLEAKVALVALPKEVMVNRVGGQNRVYLNEMYARKTQLLDGTSARASESENPLDIVALCCLTKIPGAGGDDQPDQAYLKTVFVEKSGPQVMTFDAGPGGKRHDEECQFG
jgi:hypothetical protein